MIFLIQIFHRGTFAFGSEFVNDFAVSTS